MGNVITNSTQRPCSSGSISADTLHQLCCCRSLAQHSTPPTLSFHSTRPRALCLSQDLQLHPLTLFLLPQLIEKGPMKLSCRRVSAKRLVLSHVLSVAQSTGFGWATACSILPGQPDFPVEMRTQGTVTSPQAELLLCSTVLFSLLSKSKLSLKTLPCSSL